MLLIDSFTENVHLSLFIHHGLVPTLNEYSILRISFLLVIEYLFLSWSWSMFFCYRNQDIVSVGQEYVIINFKYQRNCHLFSAGFTSTNYTIFYLFNIWATVAMFYYFGRFPGTTYPNSKTLICRKWC